MQTIRSTGERVTGRQPRRSSQLNRFLSGELVKGTERYAAIFSANYSYEKPIRSKLMKNAIPLDNKQPVVLVYLHEFKLEKTIRCSKKQFYSGLTKHSPNYSFHLRTFTLWTPVNRLHQYHSIIGVLALSQMPKQQKKVQTPDHCTSPRAIDCPSKLHVFF